MNFRQLVISCSAVQTKNSTFSRRISLYNTELKISSFWFVCKKSIFFVNFCSSTEKLLRTFPKITEEMKSFRSWLEAFWRLPKSQDFQRSPKDFWASIFRIFILSFKLLTSKHLFTKLTLRKPFEHRRVLCRTDLHLYILIIIWLGKKRKLAR